MKIKSILLPVGYIFSLTLVTILIFSKLIGSDSDDFYLKFTTPKFPSLALGSSRSSQGIYPEIFNNSNLKFDRLLYNFSFTTSHSNYGPAYLKAIKKKLVDTKNGLYLLEINPFNVSIDYDSPDTTQKFIERSGPIGQLKCFTCFPNLQYIYQNVDSPFYKYYKIDHRYFEVLDTGRLNIFIKYEDQKEIDHYLKMGIKKTITNIKEHKVSQLRIKYFKQTIKFLKKHGRVIVHRMPVSVGIRELEDVYMKNFSEVIANICKKYDVPFFDHIDMSGQYLMAESSHIHATDALKYSKLLEKEVSNYMKSK